MEKGLRVFLPPGFSELLCISLSWGFHLRVGFRNVRQISTFVDLKFLFWWRYSFLLSAAQNSTLDYVVWFFCFDQRGDKTLSSLQPSSLDSMRLFGAFNIADLIQMDPVLVLSLFYRKAGTSWFFSEGPEDLVACHLSAEDGSSYRPGKLATVR